MINWPFVLVFCACVGRRRLSVVDWGGPVEVSPAASPSTVPGAPPVLGRPDHLRPVHMGPTTSRRHYWQRWVFKRPLCRSLLFNVLLFCVFTARLRTPCLFPPQIHVYNLLTNISRSPSEYPLPGRLVTSILSECNSGRLMIFVFTRLIAIEI